MSGKVYIYGFMNVLGGFFTRTFTEIYTKEQYVNIVSNGLFSAPREQLESYKEIDLYLLGEIDNVSGEVTPCKEFLMHISEVASEVISKRFGGSEDGSTKN